MILRIIIFVIGFLLTMVALDELDWRETLMLFGGILLMNVGWW